MKTAVHGGNRFENDPEAYAAYLQTPEGRLRLDLAFANLHEFLPAPEGSKGLCALDLGCGTGVTAVQLAQHAFQVTLLDSSRSMLDIAQRAALKAGVGGRIAQKYGDASSLPSLFELGSFDLILCHNVLEYVDDPGAVLVGAASLLRNSLSVLSVLVRNQAGEVLKAAIQKGDLVGAQNALTSEWGQESLYGGNVRLFILEELRDQIKAASLRIVGERGVRMVADYLPEKVSRSEEYDRIFDLERKLGSRTEFVGASRYIQILARRNHT